MTNNKNLESRSEPTIKKVERRPLIVNAPDRQWNSGYQYDSWGYGDIGWFESDGARADYERRLELERLSDSGYQYDIWGYGDTGWN